MKCELIELEGLKRKLDIHLSSEQVQGGFDRSYKEWQKKANVPGFRKGKVPLSYIRSNYRVETMQKTVINLVNEFYLKAIKEKKLQPATDPAFDFASQIKEAHPFRFSATLEVWPKLTIKKNFTVHLLKPPLAQVEEKEIDQAVNEMRQMRGKIEEVKQKKAIQHGDIVELELEELTKPFLGVRKKQLVEIREELDTNIGSLLKNLIGLFAGDTKTVTLPPSEISFLMGRSQEGNMKGPVDLKLHILQIKKMILPDLNEEFAKQFQCQNVQELRGMIKKNIERHNRKQTDEAMREQTLKQLVEAHHLPVLPEGIIEKQKKSLMSPFLQQLKTSSMSTQKKEEQKRKWSDMSDKQARFMVHSSYLLYTLADEWNISVSLQEVQMHSRQRGAHNGQGADQNERVRDLLLREKVIARLFQSATIKEGTL